MSLHSLPLTQYMPMFLRAAWTTLWLTFAVYASVFVVGTAVAIARFNRAKKLFFIPTSVYVEVIRNVPALVVLYLVYFGMPQFGLLLDNYDAGILVLTIVIAAYLGESLRGFLEEIPVGQWEASHSLGLGPTAVMFRVILPQVIRNAWPTLVNYLMIVLFATSLLSVIDVRELTNIAGFVNDETFRPVPSFLYALVLYVVISSILQLLAAGLYVIVDPQRIAARRRRKWDSALS